MLSYPTHGSRVNPIYTPTKQQYIKVGVFIHDARKVEDEWDPINRLNPATCLCLSVPIQDLDFQPHMSRSFLCSVISVKMRGVCSFLWILVELRTINVYICIHNKISCAKCSKLT